MKVSKKKKFSKSEVPLAAMIDITFLLLAYFIITQTPPIEEAQVSINRPSTINLPTQTTQPSLDITVNQNSYQLLGRNLSMIQDVKVYIADYAKETKDSQAMVNLKLQGDAKTKRLIELLDALAAEGMEKRLNFAFIY